LSFLISGFDGINTLPMQPACCVGQLPCFGQPDVMERAQPHAALLAIAAEPEEPALVDPQVGADRALKIEAEPVGMNAGLGTVDPCRRKPV